MARTRVLACALALLLVLGGLAGCEKAAEEAVEGATGAEVETDDGSVSVESDDVSGEVDEEGVELPAGFPSDVPVYDGTITAAWENKQENGMTGYTMTVVAKEGTEEVITWYEGAFSDGGWTISNSNKDASNGMISADKDNVNVYIAAGAGSDGTDISQIVTPK